MSPAGRTLGALVLALVAAASCSADRESDPPPPDEPSPAIVEQRPESVSLTETVARVREVIDGYRGLIPGGVVLVRQGMRHRVLSWGFADTARRIRITSESPFPALSITKTLVTVRALQLVEEGRLQLDDTVEKWLPGMLPTGDQVTIEHLLSHRAGLSDAVDQAADWPIDADWTTSDLKEALVGAGPPDVETDYSNAGFILVGLILEEAGGEPLERQLTEHVFAPAGMNKTSLSADAMDDPRIVHGYDDGGHDVTPNDLSGVAPSGAAVSTVRDLDRFLTALFSYQLLDEATVADMTDPRGGLSYGDYGLGLVVYPYDCGDALGHDGAFAGYRTAAFHNPDEDRSMVLMVNTGDDLGAIDFAGNAALCP